MRELHLFAGGGGGILGGLLLGHRPVCAVEIEPYCRSILLQRQRDNILPRFPIWDDITTFDGKPWKGKVDVVAGGFPCQDISAAGKGAGIDGERSGLWSEMLRVVREVEPRYVFVENSPMLTSRGLGTVLGGLAEARYNARWCVLGADDVGAPHRRKRIWILADSLRSRLEGGERGGRLNPQRRQEPDGPAPERGEMVYPTSGGLSQSKPESGREKQVETASTIGACVAGSSWWAAEPAVGRVADGLAAELGIHGNDASFCVDRVAKGVPNRVSRLKALGNGQVPLCAATAFNLLMNYDNGS